MNSNETYIVYLCNQTDECKVYDEKINKIINDISNLFITLVLFLNVKINVTINENKV